jgi:hypothetical protein
MSESRVDENLRSRFHELRAAAEREGRAPEFGALLARARASSADRRALEVVEGGLVHSRRRVIRVGAWASAALAAPVAGVLLVDRGPSPAEEFARLVADYASQTSAGAWRSPTSGLLEVPGMELVRSVPSIGVTVPPGPGTLPDPVPEAGPREDA